MTGWPSEGLSHEPLAAWGLAKPACGSKGAALGRRRRFCVATPATCKIDQRAGPNKGQSERCSCPRARQFYRLDGGQLQGDFLSHALCQLAGVAAHRSLDRHGFRSLIHICVRASTRE
uniref:Uncharacterized protein n=1 Tax=Pseudomonas putida TaxID=303 RepID=Q8VMG9_PSEPU|nr:hypothetical protein [Pseudomonas putida]